jgi:cobalt-zinc-cadmium efflux system outer membrane protein
MVRSGFLVLGFSVCASGAWMTSARSAERDARPVGVDSVAFADDAVLRELVRQAIDARPELRRARALIQAERERVPQVRTLPDPVLALGIQNDGFTHQQIGKMETSWTSIMASQSFPWFGKRELRARVVESGVENAEVELTRAALTVRAEVERAYLDVLEVHDQADLLLKMDALWSQSEGMARSRYETGDGVQSDLLRAQLARNRLRLRRVAIAAEEARRMLVINRLRGHPAEDPLPLPSTRRLMDIPDPVLAELPQALETARARSPELRGARVEREQAERQIGLARKDSYPDVTVNAAVMPRGGPFETMWQAGLSLSLPVWSLARRDHAVAENRARVTAADASAEAIGCLLEQRVRERHALLTARVESNRIYRSGLLVQSEATVASTVAQYRVGKVPMASVLEAMAGYVTDVNDFLESAAEAQRLAIAERELSLADGGGGLPGLGSSAAGSGMTGGAGTGGPASGATAAGTIGGQAPTRGAGAATAAMSKM